jgi:hypothetical protein
MVKGKSLLVDEMKKMIELTQASLIFEQSKGRLFVKKRGFASYII